MLTLQIIIGGQLWTQTSAPIGNWSQIASDSSGLNLAAITNVDLYTSTSGSNTY